LNGTHRKEQEMTETRWKSVSKRAKWAARGASFVGKVKATKVVWFPPKPVETAKKAASTAEDETIRAAKTTRSALKGTTGTAKKAASTPAEQTIRAAKKTTGTAERTTGTAKKTTGTANRKTGTVERTARTAKTVGGTAKNVAGGVRPQKLASDTKSE
jgi:hypothetical protein